METQDSMGNASSMTGVWIMSKHDNKLDIGQQQPMM